MQCQLLFLDITDKFMSHTIDTLQFRNNKYPRVETKRVMNLVIEKPHHTWQNIKMTCVINSKTFLHIINITTHSLS